MFLVLLSGGCSGKPSLQLQDVRSVQFGNTIASSAVLAELVTAYQRASLIRDDVETTHPVRVDVVLASGETLVIWGGDTGFQTVAFRGRQFNLQGEELEGLFHRLLAFHTSDPLSDGPMNGNKPIRAETNRTSSAAGSRR